MTSKKLILSLALMFAITSVCYLSVTSVKPRVEVDDNKGNVNLTSLSTPKSSAYAVKELWNDFFRSEWSYMFLEHTEKMIKATGRNLPISPAIEGLERSPNINPDDIMPERNVR